MKKLTFDEYKALVDSIEVPLHGYIGIFRVKINNANKRYVFHGLKQTASFNEDHAGFSLNHYFSHKELPVPTFKKSQFHGEGGVNINIDRADFGYAIKTENYNEINISMRTWSAQINW